MERLATDTPDSVAVKLQQHDRITYTSETAEAYHAVKHSGELDGVVEVPDGNRVARYAEATRLTLRDSKVHSAHVKSNGSVKVVIRRRFLTTKPDVTAELEAMVFVQTDGNIVMATFGAKRGNG